MIVQIGKISGMPPNCVLRSTATGNLQQRNCTERMFGRLENQPFNRNPLDQLANSFLAMVHIATARYWLKFVHAA